MGLNLSSQHPMHLAIHLCYIELGGSSAFHPLAGFSISPKPLNNTHLSSYDAHCLPCHRVRSECFGLGVSPCKPTVFSSNMRDESGLMQLLHECLSKSNDLNRDSLLHPFTAFSRAPQKAGTLDVFWNKQAVHRGKDNTVNLKRSILFELLVT